MVAIDRLPKGQTRNSTIGPVAAKSRAGRKSPGLDRHAERPRTRCPVASTSHVLAELREVHRMREDLMRPRVRLGQQIGAIRRRMGPRAKDPMPGLPIDAATSAAWTLIQARQVIEAPEKEKYKLMVKLAQQLPVWPWVQGVKGLGAIGLAQIVAEAGDLSAYPKKGHLWKRFGLAVIDGKGQRRSKDDWEAHGFNSRRRAIMHCIGDSAMRQGPYRAVYLSRKEIERTKEPDAAPIVHHKRALRYMEKRILKDLWVEWRRVCSG